MEPGIAGQEERKRPIFSMVDVRPALRRGRLKAGSGSGKKAGQRAPIGASPGLPESPQAKTAEHERRSLLDLDCACPLRGLLWGLCAPFRAVRCRYVCHRAALGAVPVERKLC